MCILSALLHGLYCSIIVVVPWRVYNELDFQHSSRDAASGHYGTSPRLAQADSELAAKATRAIQLLETSFVQAHAAARRASQTGSRLTDSHSTDAPAANSGVIPAVCMQTMKEDRDACAGYTGLVNDHRILQCGVKLSERFSVLYLFLELLSLVTRTRTYTYTVLVYTYSYVLCILVFIKS